MDAAHKRTLFLKNTTADANETFSAEIPSDWAAICGDFVAFAVIICGIIGNAVTIAAYWRNRKLQTSFNHLITNLCAVDLLFSGLVMPSVVVPLLTAKDIYPTVLCHFFGYLYNFLMSSSVINLVFIAVNRYIGIVHSSKYRFLFSSDLIKWYLVSVWLSGPLLYLPLLASGGFTWVESRLECTVTSRSLNYPMKTYVIILYHALQLFPAIILMLLYRAIFKKVKNCRKTVEHYPTPVSCTPSLADANDGSHVSRGRLRSLRRQNSFNITERESPSIQKRTSSPLSFPKTGQMAYLQVPDVKSSPMLEPKQTCTSYFGGKSLPFRTEVIKAEKSSLDPFTEDAATDVKVKEKEQSTSTSLEDDVLCETQARPLLTSERPRRRLLREMRDWQIMSTIESEPTSKTMSIDRGDETTDAKSPSGSFKSSEEKSFTIKMTEKQMIKRNSSLGKLTRVEEKDPEPSDILDLPTTQDSCEDCEVISTLVPEVNTTASKKVNKDQDSKDHIFSLPNLNELSKTTAEIIKPHTATTRFSSHPDRKKSSRLQVSSSLIQEEPYRRHSISTCSSSLLALDKNGKQEYKKGVKTTKRGSVKRWSWKRAKYNSSPSNPQRSSLEIFRGRRIKSEGSQPQLKSLKRTWNKKANSAKIKIVIDQATSEDTLPESIRHFSEMMCDEKLLKDKITKSQVRNEKQNKKDQGSQAKICHSSCENICLTSKSDCCRNLICKIKRRHDRRQNDNTSSSAIKDNKESCHKSNKMSEVQSVESLPSTLPSLKAYHETSILNENKTTNVIQEQAVHHILKDFQSSTNQYMTSGASELTADQNDAGIYNERRSSITSHVYRYGAEEALSRHGSVSYVSCADDYTRTRNNNRVASRDCTKTKIDKSSSKGTSRKTSVYINWTRKSFCLSSFNSSATSTESRRRKRRRDAERQLVYNGLIICIALGISILPLFVINILEVFTNLYIPPNVTFTAVMLSWLQAIINPAIYGLLNPQYRMEFKRMWRSAQQHFIFCLCRSSEPSKPVVFTSNMSPLSKTRFHGSGADHPPPSRRNSRS